MKLLHTSDWHLGMSAQGRSLEDDQRFFLDAICRGDEDAAAAACEEHVDRQGVRIRKAFGL